ncbi:MAG: DUF4239 domain-containing protein [Candidatus Pacearchaeota archaeon]
MFKWLDEPYVLEVLVVIGVATLAILFEGPFKLEEMGTFLTIVGFVYGVLAAFTMTHAWNRFVNIRAHNSQEASALINLVFLSNSFKENKLKNDIKKKVKDYCDFMLRSKWGEVKGRIGEADKKLLGIVSTVKRIKVSEKEDAIIDKYMDQLITISNNKSNQMVLTANRVTKEHWILLGFLSLVTSLGLFLANDPSSWLSVFTTAAGVSVITLIIIAIYDMDNLSFGTEAVTVAPYRRVLNVIEKF